MWVWCQNNQLQSDNIFLDSSFILKQKLDRDILWQEKNQKTFYFSNDRPGAEQEIQMR